MSKFNFVEDDFLARTGKRGTTNPILWEFANALKSNPGRWAEYPISQHSGSYSSNIASRITRHHDLAPAPLRQGFEARTLKGVMYVRYIGEVVA